MTGPSSTYDSNQQDDKELRNTLDEANRLGRKISDIGRELTAAGQYILDWADITREAIPLIGTPQGLFIVNKSWEHTNRYLGQTISGIDQIDVGAVASTSAGSALTSVLNLSAAFVSAAETCGHRGTAEHVVKHIEEQTTKSHEKEVVMSLMRSLSLDSRSGGTRSPLEQLETSYKAFENTVDASTPALTSLIPMRECILQTIAVFLRKRNHQEKTRGTAGKVTSILRQLKRDSIPEESIESISTQCKDILDNRLSPSKNSTVTRSEWQHALVSATLWLRSFISAIDPGKTKSTTT